MGSKVDKKLAPSLKHAEQIWSLHSPHVLKIF